MSLNIEMQMKQDNGNYVALYPKTLGGNISGAVSNATNAVNANKATLAYSVNKDISIAVKLDSDVSQNIDLTTTDETYIDTILGVEGILPVTKGGTGVTSYSSLATKISSYLSSGMSVASGTRTGTGGTSFTINTNLSKIVLFYHGQGSDWPPYYMTDSYNDYCYISTYSAVVAPLSNSTSSSMNVLGLKSNKIGNIKAYNVANSNGTITITCGSAVGDNGEVKEYMNGNGYLYQWWAIGS